MKKLLVVLSVSLLMISELANSRPRYGEILCKQPDYECLRVKRGQNWNTLFPDAEKRDIVRRVNRMNTNIWTGMTIAVPKKLHQLTVYDVSPFPRYIDSDGEKTIFVSQKKLAWGAYDEDGELVWWGPISPGKGYCADVAGGRCGTPSGSFRIIRKQGIDCVSSAFPRRSNGDHGGAPMPYCMHFFRGFALHGSTTVPGRPDSHGCVRLFTEDARWLNQEFIDTQSDGLKGTKVVVEGA